MLTEISDAVQSVQKDNLPSGNIDVSLFPGTLQFPTAPYFEQGGYRVIPLRFGEVDERRVREIINSGFAPETLIDQFFEENANALFLLEEQGRSVAVVNGRYLNVLATRRENWLNGVGKAVESVYLGLVERRGGWRSRVDRPINAHYTKIPGVVSTQAGLPDGNHYNLYTIGLQPSEEKAAHAFMYAKPSNFQ